MLDSTNTISSALAQCDPSVKAIANSVQCGDSAELLRDLPKHCVDLVITSPPYYLQRSYNGAEKSVGQESTPEEYLEALMTTFRQCVRVLKPTGNIVYNLGDKYLNGSLSLMPFRFAISICDKFELKLINEITWVKRNPTPRQFNRRLVASTEPFFHFALSDNYFYDRKGFLSSEKKPTRPAPTPKLGQKYRTLIDESVELTEQQKLLAHQELDDVIADVQNGKLFGFRMKIKGIHAGAFGGQEGGRKGQIERKGFTIIRMNGEKMKRDVIESTVETLPGNKHTAVFPLTIIRELVRLLCPKKGLVLDPYIGSGTTAVAAIREKRDYLGIEIDPVYCAYAQERIAQTRALNE